MFSQISWKYEIILSRFTRTLVQKCIVMAFLTELFYFSLVQLMYSAGIEMWLGDDKPAFLKHLSTQNLSNESLCFYLVLTLISFYLLYSIGEIPAYSQVIEEEAYLEEKSHQWEGNRANTFTEDLSEVIRVIGRVLCIVVFATMAFSTYPVLVEAGLGGIKSSTFSLLLIGEISLSCLFWFWFWINKITSRISSLQQVEDEVDEE